MDNSTQSFEQVALPHLDVVFRAAMALCGKRNDAEDLAQGTFVKALEKFDSFTAGTNCKAWLFQILRHLWMDQLRHQKIVGTAVPIDDTLVDENQGTKETIWSDARDLLENFSDEQVIRALTRLPEDQRLTLFLTDVERLSQEEIAEITGVAIGTVKSRTSRARISLKYALTAYAQEMGFFKG